MKAERDYGSGLSPPTVFAPLFYCELFKTTHATYRLLFLGSSKKWRDRTVRVASTEHAGKGYSLYEKLLHRNFTMHQTMMQPVSDAIGRNKGDDQRELGPGRALEKF